MVWVDFSFPTKLDKSVKQRQPSAKEKKNIESKSTGEI